MRLTIPFVFAALCAASAGSAAAGSSDKTFSQQYCFTSQGSSPVKIVPTTTNTRSATFTVVYTTTVTPTTTIAPGSTVTSTTSKTIVSTSTTTANAVSKTATITNTPTSTITSTATAITTATATTTATTTTTVTPSTSVTVPTPSGFTPLGKQVEMQGLQPARKRSIRSQPWSKSMFARASTTQKNKSAPRYPAKVTCEKAVEVVHVNTKTNTASQTATVTQAAPTTTVTSTSTQATTVTVMPPQVTKTVTVTAAPTSVTTTSTTTGTTTTTSTATQTESTILPVQTSYAVCASPTANDPSTNNFVQTLTDTSQTPNDVYRIFTLNVEPPYGSFGSGSNSRFDATSVSGIASAAECCSACQSVTNLVLSRYVAASPSSASQCNCIFANEARTSCANKDYSFVIYKQTSQSDPNSPIFSAQGCASLDPSNAFVLCEDEFQDGVCPA